MWETPSPFLYPRLDLKRLVRSEEIPIVTNALVTGYEGTHMYGKLIKLDSSTVKMHIVWKIFWVLMILFFLVFWGSIILAQLNG